MIKITRGLDLPITGVPQQKMPQDQRKEVRRVAIVGEDYVGLRPSLIVKVGDRVKKGQLLLSDKKTPGVGITSPISGKVLQINRGERRVFQSLVIGIEGNGDAQVVFSSFKRREPQNLKPSDVRKLLLESGLWPALRTRPFGHIPDPHSDPHSLFVTAMDTHPLAPDPLVAITEHREDFRAGLHVLRKLVPQGQNIYLCHAPSGDSIPGRELPFVKGQAFSGPHPAGNVGTHIHFLDPIISKDKTVWHINYQDVIAYGRPFLTGQLFTGRVVALGGPMAKNPRLIRAPLGACLSELCEGEIREEHEVRRISGPVLGGRLGEGVFDYLGRYHHQVSLLEERRERQFLGWQSPGLDKFSVARVFLSKLFPKKTFPLTTSRHGSIRSIVPIGLYEKVMPLDILPTFLLRAIEAKDIVRAQELGILELDEEDVALCTFVDPCKNEFGIRLRECLSLIERDGL